MCSQSGQIFCHTDGLYNFKKAVYCHKINIQEFLNHYRPFIRIKDVVSYSGFEKSIFFHIFFRFR